MKIVDVYEKIIIEKLSDAEQCLYVFQGFPYEFYEAVNNSGLLHLSGKKPDSYVDYNSLNNKEEPKNLLMCLMTSKDTAWIFYEEFVALSDIVSDFSIYSGKIVIVKNNLFNDYFPIPVYDKFRENLNVYSQDSNDDKDIFKYYSDCKLIDDVMYYAYVNKHYEIDTGMEIEERNFYEPESSTRVLPNEYEELSLSLLKNLKNSIQLGKIKNTNYYITEHSATLFKELEILNQLGRHFNVFVFAEKSKRKKTKVKDEYLSVLKRCWGNDAEFRDNLFYEEPETSSVTIDISQGEIVADIIHQCLLADKNQPFSDLIVTAPTGAGKSLLFQIPSIYLYEELQKITIVICPLVALMVDQVKELNDRGIDYATFINSSISFGDRRERLDGIKSGKYSIVYLSPELLLSTDIRTLIDKRKVGLIVVDEAHLVTSWGRDFRIDYWFLGDYLEKVRHGSYYSEEDKINVPILCLTATAVFGGKDDIIGDLQSTLQLICNSEQLYIGYVRRNNIEFNIRRPKQEKRSNKEAKIGLTIKELENCLQGDRKAIAYFPYKSSIADTRNYITGGNSTVTNQIVVYHGECSSNDKDEAYKKFRNNEKRIMLATKAFGMGVNISDIDEVYHFAPTGTLADYVQEIGRAARKLDKGYAVIDYLPTDMNYARTLWGLSGLRHYQIQEMIKKLYELYSVNCKRNILVSPDTFSYLFDETSLEGKVKSGLMLLMNDLFDKYHFRVISVRPKNLFAKQFITVPFEVEGAFLSEYQKYCIKMDNVKEREDDKGTITSKIGNVFEIDLAALWENEFSEMTFPKFKWDFFEGKLFDYGEYKIVPNIKLTIRYTKKYEETEPLFRSLAKAIQLSFNEIKRKYGGREFDIKVFTDAFNEYYEGKIRNEHIRMLFDLFCFEHIDAGEYPKENWKFIARKKQENDGEQGGEYGTKFCIRTNKFSYIKSNLIKYFSRAVPNSEEKEYVTYVAFANGHMQGSAEYQLLAAILQLFDMATYEMNGGQNPEIFVRINDPQKLKRIATEKIYRNRILKGIEERHERAVILMDKFMCGNFSNEERWEIIEEYFLGHDEVVDSLLASGNRR